MTEFKEIMQRYGYEVVELSEWLGTDIVRLIELLDAELQNRSSRFDDAFDIYDYDGVDDV